MGIAYKDLVAWRYYKGTLDNGSKVYLFVESVAPMAGGVVGVAACRYERKTGGAGWVSFGAALSGQDDSRMRRMATLAEIQSEGIPQAPLDLLTPKPPSKDTTGSGTKVVSSPSKPPARRKDGSPKATIEENKTSATCLHCSKKTKTMVLFQWSVQWCSECEP